MKLTNTAPPSRCRYGLDKVVRHTLAPYEDCSQITEVGTHPMLLHYFSRRAPPTLSLHSLCRAGGAVWRSLGHELKAAEDRLPYCTIRTRVFLHHMKCASSRLALQLQGFAPYEPMLLLCTEAFCF